MKKLIEHFYLAEVENEQELDADIQEVIAIHGEENVDYCIAAPLDELEDNVYQIKVVVLEDVKLTKN